jgi:ribosomal protein L37AE/L43A
MARDPFFRCPGCGSLLTVMAALPGIWECRYCFCLFPVELEEKVMDIIASW